MTMGVANQALMVSSAVLLENSQYKEYSGVAVSALALGAQYGVLLPYSRTHESEADAMGLAFSAQAGFDPSAAVNLWRKMQKASKGAPPEFMSTHPAHNTRIQNLNQQLPSVQRLYLNNRLAADSCKKPV